MVRGQISGSEGVRILTVKQEGVSSLKHVQMILRSPGSQFGRWFRPVAAAAFLSAAVAPATYAQATTGQTFCQPQVVGNRRIPKESVIARLFERQGDAYDPSIVERDFNSLWNTTYFEDVRIEKVETPSCVQMVIYVHEKPTIREVNYKGLNAVTQSDVLDRFKKAKIGSLVESQLDFTKIKRAEVALKGLLAEHGHQFSTVRTEVKTIPPASVAITFSIKEGPTVKVGKIAFEGNHEISSRTLRAAMRNSRPIGIPHSIILENLFSRTFDATKLDEDAERVRAAYGDKGYFKAQTGEPQTKIRDAGGVNFLLMPSHGKRIDILVPVEEGKRYRLGGIKFLNAKDKNVNILRNQFPMKDGDYFNRTVFGKGLENLRKAYGSLGYINFVGTPQPRFDEAKNLIYLDIDLDEGKKFFVSRIEFSGNTVTRDRVIRRELMLEEGQQYNNQLWELSILRLNQLNYFENLKADQDSETRTNADEGTVDLLLKLKEKGKNSIGLNGGISGLSGSFIGLNYETNNFLGLGETLSVTANVGDLSRNLTLGFTEPYFRNKPISLGFQVFATKYDYNPAKSYGATSGQSANLTNAQQSLLTNYNQSTTGLSISLQYPIRRTFKRLGVSYSLQRASVTTFNDNTRNIFETLAFRSGLAGQNQLNGIITSTITPSFTYSSIDRAVGPHSGRDLNVAVQIAGAGGNVKYFSPVVSLRQYYPMKGLRISRDGHNVLGMRAQLAHVEGFGGQVAPPFNRVYAGGETDVRGFDIRSASPYTFIPTKVMFNLTNPDGSTVPRDPTNPTLGNVQVPLPVYRLTSVGGDTSLTTNIEYRIPVGNSVTFAFFDDFNLTFDALKSQLRQSVLGQTQIDSPLYGCPVFVNGACSGGKQVSFPNLLQTAPGTNYVPRMSMGAEVQVILPIVNAPFRIYYAYNPLRLYEDLPQKLAVDNTTFRSFFPNTGAGLYSYNQALQFYGANYQLREPRKTLRLTVSTTF
ncbi:outer membrane protein assembly complex, YaeT protein [Terriglobus saanensis SP1PR4]|uniref:Outer membrane protein assembly factor BamA n=2 Tax=Terriglobus saanensis TaxID=870903 RepID=E8V3Q0_TERSS|nr:outer membrane protein assembly complex, YaeT protein [Terriglobus saanensis SP1PR4]